MLINYLLVSARNLIKDKLYSIINTLGLAIALTTCFFIYSWVSYETSYDTFDGNENIYRVVTQWDDAPSEGHASTYPMIRTRVLSQFPEVEESVRLFNTGFLGSKTRITYQTNINTNSVLYFADSTFFKMFPANFLEGFKEKALAKPNALILTHSLAAKLFQDENPIGKLVAIGKSQSYEVTGVIEDLPSYSHFYFDMIASMESHPWIKEAEQTVWSGISFHTYVKLKKDASAELLQQKINAYLDNFPDDLEGNGKNINAVLQPIQVIHLHSHLKFELLPGGNITTVYLFITIAALVLVVAIVNYINLATARYTQRFKEVGVRKVMGANRSQLVLQFISESVVVSMVSLVIAMVLIESMRPALISIADERYFPLRPYMLEVIAPFLLVTLLIGIGSGLFPALLLSGIKPVKLFKPSTDSALRGVVLRKALVAFQFAVSIVLTICTATTFQQIRFLQTQPTGYDRDQILVLNIGYSEVKEKYEALKAKLEASTAVTGVSFTSQLPTNVQTAENIDLPGGQSMGVNYISADPSFFSTLDIKVQSGNERLSAVVPNDSVHFFVMNESALKATGWTPDQALSNKISIRHGNQQPGSVVAIVKDFHFQSMHDPIGPLVVEFSPNQYEFMLVKIKPGQVQQAVNDLEGTWKQVAGTIPFDYSFLDDNYNALYKQEQLTGSLFIVFSIIALTIALLGLFGLASFAVTKRTKEIGIRKILGAEFKSILELLSKDFAYLFVFALIVAIPIGYYFQHEWLAGFAYRTEISVLLFVFAGIVNILLAFVTIAYHCFRASKINPVETLRNE